jgi:hypothetical protein
LLRSHGLTTLALGWEPQWRQEGRAAGLQERQRKAEVASLMRLVERPSGSRRGCTHYGLRCHCSILLLIFYQPPLTLTLPPVRMVAPSSSGSTRLDPKIRGTIVCFRLRDFNAEVAEQKETAEKILALSQGPGPRRIRNFSALSAFSAISALKAGAGSPPAEAFFPGITPKVAVRLGQSGDAGLAAQVPRTPCRREPVWSGSLFANLQPRLGIPPDCRNHATQSRQEARRTPWIKSGMT